MKQLRWVFIFIMLFTLAGCGFHLRSYSALPPQLHRIYLQTGDAYDPLTLQLKQSLTAAGLDITNSPKTAPLTLQIISAQFSQQLMNVSANTIVRNYNLIYTLVFQVKNRKGKVIYGPETISTSSSYTENQNQILGGNNQYAMQQQSMIREAVNLIFNRLSSAKARKALA